MVDERGVVICGEAGCRGVVGVVERGWLVIRHAGRTFEVRSGVVGCNARDHRHDVETLLERVVAAVVA